MATAPPGEESSSGNLLKQAMSGGSLRVLWMLTCLVLVIGALKIAADFLIPVSIAFFLAVLSLPLIRWLGRYRVPYGLAVTVAVLLNLSVVLLLVYIGTHFGSAFWSKVPGYIDEIREASAARAQQLEERGFTGMTDTVEGVFDWTALTGFFQDRDYVGDAFALGSRLFGTVKSMFTMLFIVFLVMSFMLVEARNFPRRLRAIHEAGGPDMSGLMNSAVDIQRYVAIKTLVSIATGLLAGLLCLAVGLEYPLLWGLIAFILNYIPAIGSTVAGIPPVIIALLTLSPGAAVIVGLGYFAINTLLGNFIEPTLLGRRFGVPTLVIVLSVLFWGWVWGPAGMFLAVPLTMIIKVVLEGNSELRWISVAMSKTRPDGVDSMLDDLTVHMDGLEMLGAGAATESPVGEGAREPANDPAGDIGEIGYSSARR